MSERLVIRPRKVRWVAWIGAVAVFAVMVVVAALLRSEPTGVYFRLADQVAMVILGAMMAGGLLLFARPRVRADAEGIEVRNVVGTRLLPWAVVHGISFPDSSTWGRLDLADDEYLPLLAIQVVDGRHAITAMRALRELYAEHAPPAPSRP